MTDLSPRYLRLLEDWVPFGMRSVYQPPSDTETACYGPGIHSHWSIQTNANVFAGLAVLATDPAYDSSRTGYSADALRDTAMKILRFILRGHKAVGGACYDGQPWGISWISVLAIERMAHGIAAMESELTDADWALIRRIFGAECDYLTDEYEVVGAIDARTGKNHPESNIWNGAILHRTAMMFPGIPRRAEYQAMGTRYLLNGISMPADAVSTQIYDGKPLHEWHEGPNFTPELGLHHHGYLNVGYMVICLSNIAMLHFSYKSRGMTPPPALYHHAAELWRLVKAFVYPDGRLLRIGGDTRVRYCYCQDYAIPAWLLALDAWGDRDVQAFEAGWLDIVAREQRANGDGSFLGERLRELEVVSPMYYHRLEGDRVSSLSMGAYWRRVYQEFQATPSESVEAPSAWQDLFHGAVYNRSETRLASFVWESCQRPSGLCLPPGDSSLAEWRWNLVGKIEGCSDYNDMRPTLHREETIPGGFHVYGEGEWWATNHIAEGQNDEHTANQRLVFAALPDGRSVVVIQQVQSANRCYLRTVQGLFLNVPNDIFNNKQRRYSWNDETRTLEALPATAETIDTGATTLVIDDQLALSLAYGAESLTIHRPVARQIRIFDKHRPTYGRSGGNLYADEICAPCTLTRHDYHAGETLVDIGFVLSTGPVAATVIDSHSTGDTRSLTVRGLDGRRYTVTADFAAQSSRLTIDD